MLRRFCDKCGEEINGNCFYQISYKYAVPDSRGQSFEVKEKEWCVKCTKTIIIGEEKKNAKEKQTNG